MDDTSTISSIVIAVVTGQGLSPTATLIRHSLIILVAENVIWWHRHRLAAELAADHRKREVMSCRD